MGLLNGTSAHLAQHGSAVVHGKHQMQRVLSLFPACASTARGRRKSGYRSLYQHAAVWSRFLINKTAQRKRVEPAERSTKRIMRATRPWRRRPRGSSAVSPPKVLNCGGIAEAGKPLRAQFRPAPPRRTTGICSPSRPVRLRHLEPLPLSLRPFVVIHTGKPIRVVGVEIYVCGKRLHRARRGAALPTPPPGRGRPATDILCPAAVPPSKRHLKKDLGAREVVHSSTSISTNSLLRCGAYHDLLPRLHITAHARNERRV